MNKKTIAEVKKAVAEMFQMNAWLDRVVYYLEAEAAMPVLSGKLHELAHRYPLMADELTELLTRLAIRTDRPGTEKDETDWSLPGALTEIRGRVEKAENLLGDTYYAAWDEGDVFAAERVAKVIAENHEILEKAVLLEQKAGKYRDFMAMDADSETFWK